MALLHNDWGVGVVRKDEMRARRLALRRLTVGASRWLATIVGPALKANVSDFCTESLCGSHSRIQVMRVGSRSSQPTYRP